VTVSLRYARVEQLLWRRTEDRVLLLPRDGGEVLALTGAAVLFWDLLDTPLDADVAVDTLAEVFERDRGEVAHAMTPVVDQLVRAHALRLEEV
jgi:hypothetical protein